MSIAGISSQASRPQRSPPRTAVRRTAGTLAGRLAGWSWTVPGGTLPSVGSATTDATLTGNADGRTSLAVGQEIAHRRWPDLVPPADRQPRYWAVDACYPTTPLVTIDCEGDLVGAPDLRRGVDSPTHPDTGRLPGGAGLAIDTAAEAASGGQIRSTTTSTLATSHTQAEAIGTALLARGAGGLRITQLVLDLEGPSPTTSRSCSTRRH